MSIVIAFQDSLIVCTIPGYNMTYYHSPMIACQKDNFPKMFTLHIFSLTQERQFILFDILQAGINPIWEDFVLLFSHLKSNHCHHIIVYSFILCQN